MERGKLALLKTLKCWMYASRYHFFLSPDFHELWRNMMSASLFTEVSMGYISTGLGDCFSALLVSPMALWLTLVDRNPIQPCFL